MKMSRRELSFDEVIVRDILRNSPKLPSSPVLSSYLNTKKNGFVTATKLGTTNKIFVAATKHFAATTKYFVDVTKYFC